MLKITDSQYEKFVNTGKVSDLMMRIIAFKIIKREELNEKELAIFYSKTSLINEIIASVAKK
jgi:hypothetical protein